MIHEFITVLCNCSFVIAWWLWWHVMVMTISSYNVITLIVLIICITFSVVLPPKASLIDAHLHNVITLIGRNDYTRDDTSTVVWWDYINVRQWVKPYDRSDATTEASIFTVNYDVTSVLFYVICFRSSQLCLIIIIIIIIITTIIITIIIIICFRSSQLCLIPRRHYWRCVGVQQICKWLRHHLSLSFSPPPPSSSPYSCSYSSSYSSIPSFNTFHSHAACEGYSTLRFQRWWISWSYSVSY